MTEVYVGLASNVEPHRHLALAISRLCEVFGELQKSVAYRNPAVGFEGEDFVNLVVCFASPWPLRDVLRHLRRIEIDIGKDLSAPRYAAKVIDLDLLLFGDSVIRHDRLAVPPLDLERTPYYLRPLMELAPQLTDPVSGRSMQALWDAYPEASSLEPVALPDYSPHDDPPQDYSPQDYSPQDYSAQDYSPQDYSAQAHAPSRDATAQGARLTLDELRLSVRLGVPDAERETPQDVLVSIAIDFERAPDACSNDAIEGTFDYGAISARLAELTRDRAFRTIEHLTWVCLQTVSGAAAGHGAATVTLTARKYPDLRGLEGGAAFQLVARVR